MKGRFGKIAGDVSATSSFLSYVNHENDTAHLSQKKVEMTNGQILCE